MDFILKLLGCRSPSRAEAPDFTQSVSVVLQTFAVLVGLSITNFFDEKQNHLPRELQTWFLFAFIALLLRYIIGSAIHLNYVYGNTDPPTAGRPRSNSVPSFFKDLVFLVVFGWLAIRITAATGAEDFLLRSMTFLGAALVWSFTDPIWRWSLLHWFGHTHIPRQPPLWLAWLCLDVLQIAVSYGFVCAYRALPEWEGALSVGVAIVYALFLFLDFGSLVRGLRIA